MTQLLSTSVKTNKSNLNTEYLTRLQYLMPHTSGSAVNLCPMAEIFGCIESCLVSSGNMRWLNSVNARKWRTGLWNNNKTDYWRLLIGEITAFKLECKKASKGCAVRLNGTSDIQWEIFKVQNSMNIFELFPDIMFYDYTKILKRCYKKMPNNYELVFSGSHVTDESTEMTNKALNDGITTALVFHPTIPELYKGIKVINGDKHDLLPIHVAEARNAGHAGPLIIGLTAKGKAKKDKSGFVINNKKTT